MSRALLPVLLTIALALAEGAEMNADGRYHAVTLLDLSNPLPPAELLKECKEEFDCGERTVYKARDRAGVVSVPDPGEPKAKLWSLDEPPGQG